MNVTIYILGILLQAVASIIALYQVRIAPRKLPWLLIALSSLLIVLRRAAILRDSLSAGKEIPPAEILTAIITFLFFLGVILMTRMFREARVNHAALQLSEQRYRDILKQAADAIIINDATGRILEANQKACTSLGYSNEGLLARNIADIYPEAFRNGKPKLWDRVFAGEQLSFEISQMRKDGSTFPAEMTVGLVRLPVGPAMLSIVRDITERMQAHDALRKSEEKFKAIANYTVDWESWFGPDGTYLWVNPAVEHFTGYSPTEIMAMPNFISIVIAEQDRAIFRAIFQEALAGSRGDNYEFRYNHKNGAQSWLGVSWQPIFDAKGVSMGTRASCRDITQRKLTEKALLEKNAELERFTHAVSHDLKSPMVTIQTFLSHLEKDLASKGGTDQVTQDLAFIKSAAVKMNALLDELLKFSKVGRGTNPSVEATLQEIAQEAICLVAGRFDQRGVRITVTEKPVTLYGERVRLVEVFQNLLDNAAKFMGDQLDPLIEIEAETKNGETVYSVRDNGMGIDPLHKDRLFGMFEKLNPEMEGTGMGLALVKKIIEVHGGRIWVESEGLGKGVCFLFTLPKGSSES